MEEPPGYTLQHFLLSFRKRCRFVPSTVATTLGAARAPDGFEIVQQCPLPDVIDRTELNKLVGQKILHTFDDEHYGWYIGTFAGTNLGPRDLEQKPRANCVL